MVDVQNDFCPGGALPVKDGDKIIPGLDAAIDAFGMLGFPIFFTRDWHPPNHISFKSQGGRWPPHCVQGTIGAGFHLGLKIPPDSVIISKGTDPAAEAYSGFQGTDLEVRLRQAGVKEIVVGGLATDYCVKESAIDGRRAGFDVRVLEDCVRPVEARPGDGARAFADMTKAGARLTTLPELVKRLAGAQQ